MKKIFVKIFFFLSLNEPRRRRAADIRENYKVLYEEYKDKCEDVTVRKTKNVRNTLERFERSPSRIHSFYFFFVIIFRGYFKPFYEAITLHFMKGDCYDREVYDGG